MAVLADEFILIHKDSFRTVQNTEQGAYRVFSKTPPLRKRGPDLSCHYCCETGHWEVDCPVLKNKQKQAVLASSLTVRPEVRIAAMPCNDDLAADCLLSYLPFVTSDRVLLPGGDDVPGRILRDTGAADSFISAVSIFFF